MPSLDINEIEDLEAVVDLIEGGEKGAVVNFDSPQDKYIASNEGANLVDEIRASANLFPSYFNDKDLKTADEILLEIGQTVVEDYESDVASRQGWEENISNILKLFSSYADPKTYPWENCSNVKLPVITVAAIQFHARAYDSLLPSKDIMRAIATGDEDIESAERVEKYINYQLSYKMKEFRTGMDTSLLQIPLFGSVFRKTYFDFNRKRPSSTYVNVMDLVLPYSYSSFEDVPRKTQRVVLYKNDIRKRVAAGVFVREAWDLGPGTSLYLFSPLKSTSDDISGVNPGTSWENMPRLFLEQHRDWDLDGDGIQEPYVITVDYETRTVVRITPRTFVDAFGQEQEIEYYTHYYFLPNPEGVYGIGLGSLLWGMNESMNSILNEVIDAGSLANLQGGFVSKRSGVSRGPLKFMMGEYTEVDTMVEDLSKAFYHFDFKGPNQTLYATLGLLYEYAKMVSSISETMTGQMPSGDTPGVTIMALIEEGRKVYSSVFKRIHTSFQGELEKIARLDSIFLDEREYFKALGDRNIPAGPQMEVGRSDFAATIDIIPVSDPNILSRGEKILKAQQVLENVRQSPLTANNMEAQREAEARYYDALEVQNYEALLAEPEPAPDLTAEEENAEMLLEKGVQVLPTNDDLVHIDIHTGFLEGTFQEELSPHAKNLIEGHNKEHVAQLYLKQTMPQKFEQVTGGLNVNP
jgi:chaperonin GroES